MSSRHRGVSYDAAETILVRIVNYGLGFIASVIITRALGPAGRGAYAVVITIATTAIALLQGPVNYANLTMWPALADRRSQLVGGSLLIGGVGGLILAGAALSVTDLLGSDLLPVTSETPLLVALAGIVPGLWATYLSVIVTADGQIRHANRAESIGAVLQTFTLLVLAWAGSLSVLGVVVVWSATMAVQAAVVLPPIFRTVGIARPARRDASDLLGRAGRYSAGLIADFLMLRVDLLILNGMVGIDQVGLYSLAVVMAEAVFLVTGSIGSAAVPRQAAEGRRGGAYGARVARTNAIVAAGLLLALTATAPLLVPLIFGEDFTGSVRPLILLAPGVLALSVRRPLDVYAAQRDRPGVLSMIMVSSLLLNVALNLALIPRWGIRGAAVASSVAYLASTAGIGIWFARDTGTRLRDFRPRPRDVTDPLRSLVGDRRPRKG